MGFYFDTLRVIELNFPLITIAMQILLSICQNLSLNNEANHPLVFTFTCSGEKSHFYHQNDDEMMEILIFLN